MRAVVFAYHDVGCRGLRALKALGVDVALVHTHEDDPAENTWFGSVRGVGAELGIPVLAGAQVNSPEEIARVRALQPDALFSFYFRDLLSDELLACGRHGAVNLHGSLLPRYRGRAPVNWQILHGEREGGVTLHDMVTRPDAGDIIDQEAFPILDQDRPADVYARLVDAAQVVLERSACAVLDGTACRVRQLESKASTYGRRHPDDGRLDFRLGAEDIRNSIRAVTQPYPGAFAFAGGLRVTIWWAEHAGPPCSPDDPPGTVRRRGADLLVACADRKSLRLVEIEVHTNVPPGAATDGRHLLRDGTTLTSFPHGANS